MKTSALLAVLVLLVACAGEPTQALDAASEALPADAPADASVGLDVAPAWCPAPGLVCGGSCVDALTDPFHCGGCSQRCGAGLTCSGGACAVALDANAEASADARESDGRVGDATAGDALVDAAREAAGAADVAPPPDGDQDVADAPRVVDAACAPAFGDCDRNPLNGCEANLRESVENCGACGVRCEGTNVAVSCVSGVCVRGACIAPFVDCDGEPANGCEVDPRTSVNHCGRCNRPCDAANTVTACVAGICRAERCIPGYADCDGNAANGCETNTGDLRNCGACGRQCGDSQVCAAGACADVRCAPPTTVCGRTCVELQTDRANCGACGNRCPSPLRATVACVAGACTVTACAAAADGEADCDGIPANGCEANLNNSSNCGACGVVCGAGRWCAPGRVCACMSPAVECGGRCARLNDPSTCGRCGNTCSDREICSGSPTVSCVSCGEDTPTSQRRRCDNVCVDLMADEHNCGACGNDCGSARLCFFGACR